MANEIRNDPLAVTIDSTMIVVDSLTLQTGEAVVGVGIRRGLREACETAGEGIIPPTKRPIHDVVEKGTKRVPGFIGRPIRKQALAHAVVQ